MINANLKSSNQDIKHTPFRIFNEFFISDTDSFLFEVQTPDFYEDLAKVKDAYYDTSNFPQESLLYSERNKAVVKVAVTLGNVDCVRVDAEDFNLCNCRNSPIDSPW